MQTVVRVATVTLWVGGLNLLPIQATEPYPEQVLQALRESDRAFWRNYSLTLAVEAPDWSVEYPDFWGEAASYRLQATSNQKATVVIRDHVHHRQHPPYSALVEWSKRSLIQLNHPPYGKSIPYIRWRKSWYLQEGRLFVEAEELETVLISPQNSVERVQPWSYLSIFIHRSSNCSSYNWLKFGLNALGRGFSQYLDKALSVKELPGGQLELWATDKRVAGNRWRLVIDPSRQFLVVEAELINSEGTVRDQYQNEGTVEAPIPLARRGTMRWYDNNASPDVSRFECVKYESCFRTDWYEEVKRIIRRPPPGTQVVDERVEPPTTFTVK